MDKMKEVIILLIIGFLIGLSFIPIYDHFNVKSGVYGQYRHHTDQIIIYSSVNYDPDYVFFTAMHELGHKFCIEQDNDYSERCADDFASEYILNLVGDING